MGLPVKWAQGYKITGPDWNDSRNYRGSSCTIFSGSDGRYYAFGHFSGSIDYSGSILSQVFGQAVEAGATHIYIASGSGMTIVTGSIPGNLTVEGGDRNVVVIKTVSPDVDYLSVGSNTVLMNLSVWDKTGLDIPLAVNGPRPVFVYYNARNVSSTASWYYKQGFVMDTGDNNLDRPGFAVNNYGPGDCYWAKVAENLGVGLNMFLTGSPSNYARGVYIINNAAGDAITIVSKPGGIGRSLVIGAESNTKSLSIVPQVNTTLDMEWASYTKTGGATTYAINMYHGESDWSGIGLIMNFGCDTGSGNGSFSGSYVSFAKDSSTVFQVNHNGFTYISGGMGKIPGASPSALNDPTSTGSLIDGTYDTFVTIWCNLTPLVDEAASAVFYISHNGSNWTTIGHETHFASGSEIKRTMSAYVPRGYYLKLATTNAAFYNGSKTYL